MNIYREFSLVNLAQIGQIHGIKYQQILIFEFQLYNLLVKDFL